MKKLGIFTLMSFVSITIVNFIWMVRPIYAVITLPKVIEETMGNNIESDLSDFVFNSSLLRNTDFIAPSKIEVYIDGVKWTELPYFVSGMNGYGIIGQADKGCKSGDLPFPSLVAISNPSFSGNAYGYNSSQVKYIAYYSDGTSFTQQASYPVVIYKNSWYVTERGVLEGYCGNSWRGQEPVIEDPIVGNDRDEYGCIPSAGTQWCESLQKCYRSWEEDCPVVTPTPEPVVEPEVGEVVKVIDVITQVQDGLEIYFDEESTLNSVTNFNITDDEFGIVSFFGVLDFSGEGMIDELNNLKEAVIIDEGVIEIDTTKVSALANKPAMLTMNGLTFSETPKILVDGKENTEGIVSNIQYNAETGSLTFDVTHFTRFEAVIDDSTVIRKVNYIRDTTWSEQTVYLVLGGGLLISTLVGLGVFILGKKVYNRIRIKRPNKTDLPDEVEKEMKEEMVEEVEEEIEEIRDITA